MSPKQIIKKHIFVIIPAVIVLLAAMAVVIPLLTPSPPRAMPPSAVTLHEMRPTQVKDSWEVVGFAQASRRVDLVARVSGFLVEKTYVDGDPVSEGQILFTIEQEQYRAAVYAARGSLLSAEARLTQATLAHARISELYAKRSAPRSDFDDANAAQDVAEADVLSARAALDQAQLNLGYAEVKAPFAGRVSDSPFSVGAYVGPGSGILATAVAADPLEVSFGVPDRVMAAMRYKADDSPLPKGQPGEWVVRVRSAGGRDYPLAGRIVYISPLVDEATGTYKLKASIPNPDGILAPGETLTVILEDAVPREALLAPKGSVLVSADAGSYVFTAAPAPGGGQGLAARRVDVRRGKEFPGGIEITGGLQAGDKVIELGLMSMGATLRDGAPVRVVEGYDPSAPPGAGAPAAGPAAGEGGA
jgi:RND family efflux transporter MFP subunit